MNDKELTSRAARFFETRRETIGCDSPVFARGTSKSIQTIDPLIGVESKASVDALEAFEQIQREIRCTFYIPKHLL